MLTGLHFLLTYTCLYECDHCFLYCGPASEGTFTLDRVEEALGQGVEAGIDTIYLEGGEPFLFYPILVESLKLAKQHGLWTGIVTNCYWALSERDALVWLQPVVEAGVDEISVSDDAFHSDDPATSPAKIALGAARKLGLPAGAICLEKPVAIPHPPGEPGLPIVGGDIRFTGRAVDTLVEGLPRHPPGRFTECPGERLEDPERVHLDPFGNVLVCQGLSIGNIRERSLREIMRAYRPADHPVIGPLLRGGPAGLAGEFGLPDEEGFVDACHLCYLTRKRLLKRFPASLCPDQVYGLGME